MNVGIVGHGVVGSAIERWLAQSAEHRVTIYDKFQPHYNSDSIRQTINECDLVFLCVPTPTGVDGFSCDTSSIDECAAWITAPLCIRSTVPPGTVDRLSEGTTQAIAFSPEYIGESLNHPWPNEGNYGFCIVGGPECIFDKVKQLHDSLSGKPIRFYRTSARTAELCKYMENCFLATKVSFVNQFFDLATFFGVEWEDLRRIWLADPRIGESHTHVTAERGFRGRCLPKDLAAMIAAAEPFGGAPLLEAVLAFNQSVCEAADTQRLNTKNSSASTPEDKQSPESKSMTRDRAAISGTSEYATVWKNTI
jgi:UDPglucose 6-dehydrogenase